MHEGRRLEKSAEPGSDTFNPRTVTMLVSSLRSPDHTGRSTSGIESSMRLVTFMSLTELKMDRRVDFCEERLS